MSLDRLWAAWRGDYVASIAERPGDPRPEAPVCVLCRVIEPDGPEEAHLLHRGEHVVAVLNRYPYVNGHLMVVPHRHVERLDELDDAESAELWRVVEDGVAAIRAAYSPGGVNVGANLGAAAGAGIPGHLHVHVLPRWRGDTNFMTSIAEVRVIPESLPATASRLQAAWPGADRSRGSDR